MRSAPYFNPMQARCRLRHQTAANLVIGRRARGTTSSPRGKASSHTSAQAHHQFSRHARFKRHACCNVRSADDGQERCPSGLRAVAISIDKESLMRKFINTFMALVMLGSFSVVLSGCTDESGVKTDTTIKSPDGSQTRETRDQGRQEG